MKSVSNTPKRNINQIGEKRTISPDNAIPELELRYRFMFESATDGI